MILPILTYGSNILRKECVDIDKDYPNLEKLIEDMFETMTNADGVGLAAPQIGKNIRLFVIDNRFGFKKVFINPQIINKSEDTCEFEEGCLSIPSIKSEVTRPKEITIKYLDENFNKYEENYTEMLSRIIQHEYDHIEGVLFTDLLLPLRKQLLKNKLTKISKKKILPEYPTK